MGKDNKLDLILAAIHGMKVDHEKQFAELNRMFAEINKENSKIKNTVIEIVKDSKALQNTVVKMSIDVNFIKQQNLKNNMILAGVPYRKGENLKTTFIKICNTLKVDIAEECFEIRRFTSKTGKNPSNILVELDEYTVKKTLLKNCKTKSILTSELGFTGDHSVVLFNQLTHDNLEILAEAKKLKTECNFKFIWFQNNQILAKRIEKAKIYTLNTKNDIAKIISSFKNNNFDSIEINGTSASSSRAEASKNLI